MTEHRRKHLRLPIESTTKIELPPPVRGQGQAARTVTCTTLNISRGGLQVILAVELAVGAILQIGVDLPGAKGTLSLAGEGRWCLHSNNDDLPWMAGFQLLDVDSSDVKQWVALISIMEG